MIQFVFTLSLLNVVITDAHYTSSDSRKKSYLKLSAQLDGQAMSLNDVYSGPTHVVEVSVVQLSVNSQVFRAVRVNVVIII